MSQCERVKMNMDKLHETHGDDVTLSEGRTVAAAQEEYGNSEVFSTQPLKPGNSFTIRVEEEELDWKVSITCTT